MSVNKLLDAIDKKKNLRKNGYLDIAKALHGENTSELPLIFWSKRNASIPGNVYNMKEQFYEKEKMLYAHLEEVEESCGCAYDAPLCIRPNFGTIFIPAILGLEFRIFEDAYPWLDGHIEKKKFAKIQIPDLDNNPMMKRAIEYIQYFKAAVPEYIHVYQPDTQGPFDIAHLIFGDEIFYEFYDDPKFVHELMEFSTQLYIKSSEKLKQAIGEEKGSCYHGHALARGIYMDNGGVRISEDSATLLSPGQIDEFVIPYVQKALNAFDGGFIHYCGFSVPLLDALLKIDNLRAINFGNPEMYDFDETMKKFVENDKVCFGMWDKKDGELLLEYVKRMKDESVNGTKGLLLHFNQSQYSEYMCQEILSIWEDR